MHAAARPPRSARSGTSEAVGLARAQAPSLRRASGPGAAAPYATTGQPPSNSCHVLLAETSSWSPPPTVLRETLQVRRHAGGRCVVVVLRVPTPTSCCRTPQGASVRQHRITHCAPCPPLCHCSQHSRAEQQRGHNRKLGHHHRAGLWTRHHRWAMQGSSTALHASTRSAGTPGIGHVGPRTGRPHSREAPPLPMQCWRMQRRTCRAGR